MSIIFKPKIREWFGTTPKPTKVVEARTVRPLKYWTSTELQKVVDLRALGVSLLDCAKLLKRGQHTISATIVHHDLYGRIAAKRRLLIDEVMKV